MTQLVIVTNDAARTVLLFGCDLSVANAKSARSVHEYWIWPEMRSDWCAGCVNG